MRSGCRSCYHLCISEWSDPVFLLWYFVWVSGEALTLPSSGKPRLSLFMICVTYAGPSLGVFDTSKAMKPPAQGPLAPIVSGVPTPVSSGSGAQKFQLGETPPVVHLCCCHPVSLCPFLLSLWRRPQEVGLYSAYCGWTTLNCEQWAGRWCDL